MNPKARAWAEINIPNLKENLEQFKNMVPEGTELMPAVKADGYGHGGVIVAKAMAESGIKAFCVASLSEGVALRKAGIDGLILILGYTHPDNFPELVEYGLTQTVVDANYAAELNAFGQDIDVHVGIDTGMRRLGERSENIEAILSIWQYEHLHIKGVFSHLCISDDLSEKAVVFTQKQIKRYNDVVAALREHDLPPFKTHLQGSYGILNYPDLVYDYARVGISVYGVHGEINTQTTAQVDLKPVLSLHSRIASLKNLYKGEPVGYGLTYEAPSDQRLATIAIGYADGYPRALSNCGEALIRGVRVPVVGRICMDQLIVDATAVPDAQVGDQVTFIGTSQNETISAEMVAEKLNTITNELLSALGSRVERVVIE